MPTSEGGPIVHIVGARPNFMKAAPVFASLRARGVRQLLVHTGQHYDPLLSDVFFADLQLPAPDRNLGVGSGTHAEQTAALLVALERAFVDVSPVLVVVYGDVNSTVAAALVAAKLMLPLAHVEAGLRSFDMTMPEEVNRMVTDILSSLLFTTSPEAADNLAAAGVDRAAIHFVGNPMIDTLVSNIDRLDAVGLRRRLRLPDVYGVATLHRPANVDDPIQARRMVRMLAEASSHAPVVFPVHPRGRASLEQAGLVASDSLRLTDPMGYVDFLSLVRGARFVVTDSGGIQEESTMLDVPCLTVRPNTERPITISHGTNRLVEPGEVDGLVADIVADRWVAPEERPPLWDGHASDRIAEVIDSWLRGRA